MQRPVQTVLIESIVIGLMNAGLFYMLKMLKIVVPTHILLIMLLVLGLGAVYFRLTGSVL